MFAASTAAVARYGEGCAVDTIDPHKSDILRPGWPIIPGYRIEERIGRGGFATVYRAYEETLRRDVAIKILHVDSLSDDSQRRFERECRAVGSLSGNRNIVNVYGVGATATGQPYLSMEYLENGSLGARLVETGSLSAAEAVTVMLQLLDGIEAAHAKGIIHRDIKPDNVLISRYGEPKLADFGISSIPGEFQTSTGTVSATMAFAAPEVLNGERAGRLSDIYSLAATTASLITGGPLFPRKLDELVLPYIRRVLTEEPPDLTAFGASADLNRVLQQSLAKEPAQRYPTIAQLRAELKSVPEADTPATIALSTGPRATSETEGTRARPTVLSRAPDVDIAGDPSGEINRETVIRHVPDDLADETRARDRSVLAPPTRRRKRTKIVAVAAAIVAAGLVGGWVIVDRVDHAGAAKPKSIVAKTHVARPSAAQKSPAVVLRPAATCTGFTCRFTAGGGTAAAAVTWSFSDGNTATGVSATRRFARSGKYWGMITNPAQGAASPKVYVNLIAISRKVTAHASPAGDLRLSVSISGGSRCGTNDFVIEKLVGNRWVVKGRGDREGRHEVRVYAPGTYRVQLVARSEPGGAYCVPVNSNRARIEQQYQPPTNSGPTNPPASHSANPGGGANPSIHPPINP